MTTFVLIHGGGGTAAFWNGVAGELTRLGHETVAMDLPCDDPDAGYEDYARTVIEAARGAENPVIVAHSAGGFIAPLVAEAIGARGIVLLAAMVPAAGETFSEWWENTGYGSEVAPDWEDPGTFYNGVPPELAEEDTRLGEGRENFPSEPYPMENWPDVPTKYILFREDRLFPPDFMRRVADERLELVPDETAGGHCAILSHPEEISGKLDGYRFFKESV